jgi:formylglycine-generating enzyme required for sulfatase activity
MAPVPSGTFVMGSDTHYPEERPAHERLVDQFWMDAHPVTNAEFRRFVRHSGYVTVAEQAPQPDDFPDADPADLVPGSLVFRQPREPVPLDDWRRWWSWVPGAHWKAPEGPGSTLHGRELHPVVHVAFEDASAYAEWAGKDLPTEPEWEYAARAGRPPTTYAWGDEVQPHGRRMANTWHGRFPWENLAPHGGPRTSPIGRYRANDWGLVDMIGNVWEWTSSPWTASHHPMATAAEPAHTCCAVNASTAVAAHLAEGDRRVMKGGSHLCSPSYCLRYRPPARQGQAVRSTTGHLGFRCVLR